MTLRGLASTEQMRRQTFSSEFEPCYCCLDVGRDLLNAGSRQGAPVDDEQRAVGLLPSNRFTRCVTERLHEEFKRRIKTQTVLPSADTAAMLFWALLASGQIVMRKIDGWNTLSTVSSDQQKLDAAA